MKKLILGCALACSCMLIHAKEIKVDPPMIIPTPLKVEFPQSKTEPCQIKVKDFKIVYDEKNADLNTAAKYLSTFTRIDLDATSSTSSFIKLEIVDSLSFFLPLVGKLPAPELMEEAYKLVVTEKNITIQGGSYRAIMNGIQSLLQLMPKAIYSSQLREKIDGFAIAQMTIFDMPKYAYRGMHYDVCRHFFTVEETKKFLDYMAMHKLNKLHWHLTDDQGWRIEIKKYPELMKKSTIRRETPKMWQRTVGDGVPYGPYYYTQEQAREIVAYAKTLGIDVIPEIELPGHATAALAAYPELGCNGGPYEPWCHWGVADSVFCAGNDSVLRFLEGVFDEVCEIFPYAYVHIGGDECPTTEWMKCPKCKARMKNEKLSNGHALQSWFVTQIANYLTKKGKIVIGWDEVLSPDIPKSTVIMSWQGINPGIRAVRSGHRVIMTPGSHLYFDYAEGKGPHEPEAIGGFLPIEQVYSFDVNCGLPPEQSHMIIGAQANCWSEYFHDFPRLEYAILPRICALSEVTWHAPKFSKEGFGKFMERVTDMYSRYAVMGANFRFVPPAMPEKVPFLDKVLVDIPSPKIENVQMFYTITPTATNIKSAETIYTGPFEVTEDCEVEYGLRLPSGLESKRFKIIYHKVVLRKPEKQEVKNAVKGLHRTLVKGHFNNCAEVVKASLNAHHTDHAGLTIHSDNDPANHYGVIYKGLFRAPQNGKYTFTINSDDGSQLYFGSECLINHDGHHGPNEARSASIFFETGWHRFSVIWFDAGGGKTLKIQVQRDGEEPRDLLDKDFVLETTEEP